MLGEPPTVSNKMIMHVSSVGGERLSNNQKTGDKNKKGGSPTESTPTGNPLREGKKKDPPREGRETIRGVIREKDENIRAEGCSQANACTAPGQDGS